MKRAASVLLTLAVTVFAHPAHAQKTHAGGLFNNCVSTFYDPEEYNWYSIRNNCREDLAITYCGVDRGGCSEADVGAGKKTSTGLTRSEVNERGGVQLYPCRDNYIAVDAANEPVRRGNQQYRCRSLDGEHEIGTTYTPTRIVGVEAIRRSA